MHRTLLDEHFRVVGRSKCYEALEEMQADLQVYLKHYNEKRPHQGRGINGRTPYRVFKAGVTKTYTKKARFSFCAGVLTGRCLEEASYLPGRLL